jgi:serine/threonine-protein phosphatase 2A regulatory subunit B
MRFLPQAVSRYQRGEDIAFPLPVPPDVTDPEGQDLADLGNSTGELLHASTKRVFANAHAYHINSLALNSDTETFVSADDLRINLWKMETSDTCFSKLSSISYNPFPFYYQLDWVDLVDIKPDNMEELTEVITAVQCHPTHCNILTYSSSRGAIKVVDLRASALCQQYSRVYAENSMPSANKSFITDILNSISDIK